MCHEAERTYLYLSAFYTPFFIHLFTIAIVPNRFQTLLGRVSVDLHHSWCPLDTAF